MSEQRALNELRQKLHALPEVEKLLRQGGEPGLTGDTGIDDRTLLRWLHAEDLNVDKALQRLQKHAQWRVDYCPQGFISEAEVKNELAANKYFVQGYDKQGRPVIYMATARHSRSAREVNEAKRGVCYVLDACGVASTPERNPGGKMVTILDMRGFGLDGIDPTVLRAGFELLQNHYPERLGVFYFVEAPYIFWGMWKMVSPFIDPLTRQKINFVTADLASKTLSEIIDPQILPKELGGQADLQPVQKFVASLGPRHASSATANGVKFKDDDAPLEEVNYTPNPAETQAEAGAKLVPTANNNAWT